MIDLHTHCLPKIDDGSKNVEMSLDMLRESAKQGIDAVVATPHFYINHNSIERFLKNRENSYNALKEHMSVENGLPNIYLGAEVYYFNGIGGFEYLNKLTLNNSQYLLLEMPFNKWNDKVFSDVEDIIYNQRITPVIAHIERFINYQKGTDNIERLLNMKVIAQMNGEYVLHFLTKGKALQLVKNGAVKLLGSDMHNTTQRPQNLGKACDIIERKLGKKVLDDINNLGKYILGI